MNKTNKFEWKNFKLGKKKQLAFDLEINDIDIEQKEFKQVTITTFSPKEKALFKLKKNEFLALNLALIKIADVQNPKQKKFFLVNNFIISSEQNTAKIDVLGKIELLEHISDKKVFKQIKRKYKLYKKENKKFKWISRVGLNIEQSIQKKEVENKFYSYKIMKGHKLKLQNE
ncbi:MSC_0621 family F1-like ATPase epsilon subunit [Mycoplasma procyoni]|uniref:MSC_0621 family F1-like ATPase epsilon subunit n=1 Tax=Mycoplasma procyoni TaxID=568784 RepID=UPI00197B3AAC|nr:hypothetical protein [Mycoplasma procyoni]MBN3534775.1 hypothetical protein [Mycoplasma procyoni]